MKIIPERYIADDETEHPSKEACEAYEATKLPIIMLLRKIDDMIAVDTEFASKIEERGIRLQRERIARGDLKRTRKSKSEWTDTSSPSGMGHEPPDAPGEYEAPGMPAEADDE